MAYAISLGLEGIVTSLLSCAAVFSTGLGLYQYEQGFAWTDVILFAQTDLSWV